MSGTLMAVAAGPCRRPSGGQHEAGLDVSDFSAIVLESEGKKELLLCPKKAVVMAQKIW